MLDVNDPAGLVLVGIIIGALLMGAGVLLGGLKS